MIKRRMIPAVLAALLIAFVCAGCIAKDSGSQEPPFPEVEMVFPTDNTDLIQIGWDAARFYYGQFMTEDTPQYWHITKHAVLSCELVAGDEREFVVSVTSFIETDGAGFLVGQGIPNNEDINNGGDCPDVQRQIRIKALGDGRYEIVGIGTGGYTQGLKLKVNLASCELTQIRNGETLRTVSLPEDGIRLAEDAIATYFLQSDVQPLMDMETLDEYYLLRAAHRNGTIADYCLYMQDGDAVMQEQTQGYGSRIDVELYLKIEKLAPREAAGDGAHADAANVDRTDLDACVSDAVISHNIGQYPGGDFSSEAHTYLETVEEGSETTVYIMALYLEFSFAGGELTEGGGCHGPVAITFEKNDAGEYVLKDYWEPQDGGGYAPSIEAKFPAGIDADVLDTQKYITAHMQSCYAQAVAYGHVDTDTMIAGFLETVVSSPAQMSDPQAYIDAHVMEYRELIYLGEYTLRYCFGLFEQGEQTGLEGHIMAAACRDILGEAGDTGLPASTGQGWYDALPQSVKDRYR